MGYALIGWEIFDDNLSDESHTYLITTKNQKCKLNDFNDFSEEFSWRRYETPSESQIERQINHVNKFTKIETTKR